MNNDAIQCPIKQIARLCIQHSNCVIYLNKTPYLFGILFLFITFLKRTHERARARRKHTRPSARANTIMIQFSIGTSAPEYQIGVFGSSGLGYITRNRTRSPAESDNWLQQLVTGYRE